MGLNRRARLSILPKGMQRMESFMESSKVEESLNTARTFWPEQKKLIKKLTGVARRIGEGDKNILRIILSGSIGERRDVPGSEAGILVLLKKSSKPFIERIPEWLKKLEIGFPLDVFPCTADDAENPVVKTALTNGVVLREKSFQNGLE